MTELCQRILDRKGILDEWMTSRVVPICKEKMLCAVKNGHCLFCDSKTEKANQREKLTNCFLHLENAFDRVLR